MPNATSALSEQAAQLAARLTRNTVDALPAGALAEKLALARSEGRSLRVKLGIDPTAPDIHLGHAVVLRKLREFQDAGHRVILIIGDYTARVGDPSGRSSERPMLSPEEIDANAATFQEQATKILTRDPEVFELRCNSEWLDMPIVDLLALLRTTTAAQLLEREDFAQRWAAKQPISLLELVYPLLQAYDSVAVRADIELGGTDQKFNLLLGRDIQRTYGQPPQAILTMPLLVGTDGHRKMSKSLGNHIAITDPPAEIYGKTMNIPDEVIGEYRRLLLADRSEPDSAVEGGASDRSDTHEDGARRTVPAGPSARDAKRELAAELVGWLHSARDADVAAREFERIFADGESPQEIENAEIEAEAGVVHLPTVIAQEFDISRSEARRLLDQGGVELGDAQLLPGEYDVSAARAEGQVLRVGKRRFRRLRVS